MTAKEIAQHAKGNDNKKTITTEELKNRRVTLNDSYKKKTRRKSKGTRTGIKTGSSDGELRVTKREKRETWSLRKRKRDLEPKEKSY